MILSTSAELINDEVQRAWAELVSRYPWHWFTTLTYRRDVGVGPESCLRNFRGWIYGCLLDEARRVGLADPGEEGERARGTWPNAYRAKQRWARPVWVIGVEPHADGVSHIHGVLRLPAALANARRGRGGAWEAWWKCHGMARIEPPRSQRHVARYVSKYVVKGGEIVLSETFDAASMLCAG